MGGRQLTPSLSVPFEFINFLGDSKATPRKIWRGTEISTGSSLCLLFSPQGTASRLSPPPLPRRQGQNHYLSARMGLCLLRPAAKESSQWVLPTETGQELKKRETSKGTWGCWEERKPELGK